MAYKRMKPVRPPGSAPIATQFATELRHATALKDKGRRQEALQQLENLHRRYPNRMEPLNLLLEMALENKNNLFYADVIGRMLKITPDNPDMVLAQAKVTLSNGQIALALQRFHHFVVRWPQHEEAQEARETLALLEEQLTNMMDEAGLHQAHRFELAAKNDEVQSFMLQGRWDEARSLARQLLDDSPHYAPALNNVTLTYILAGQLDQGISYAQRVLEFEPDNVHALGNLARSLQLLGHREEAALYAERMQASEAFAADKADKIAETLSFLGDDAGVLALYQRAQNNKSGSDLQSAFLHHLAGAAAMRLGQQNEAQGYWKQALKLDPDFAPTKDNLADLKLPVGERNAPWAFSFGSWIQKDVLRELASLMEAGKRSNPEKGVAQALHATLQNHPYLQTLVPILLERGDPGARKFALLMAKTAQTPEMLAALRDFALSQNGADQMRLDAANAAVQAGLLDSGMVRLWIRGAWQEVMLMGWEIYSEVEGSVHPPRVEKLAEEALEALYNHDGKRGEKLLLQALAIEPDAPDLLNNLANAYRMQDRAKEADELMARIYNRFPDYFFGKISLAHLHREQGRLEDAEKILTSLLSQQRLHFTEFAALAQASIELALAKGEQEQARQWYDMWKQALPDHPNLMRYRLMFDAPDLLKPGVLQNLFKWR